MRIASLLLVLAMASGCAHTHATLNAGHGTTGLVVAGMFIVAAADYSQDPYPPPSFAEFADWFRGAPPPPELDASRRVVEHDCTRPLPETSGNLRCR